MIDKPDPPKDGGRAESSTSKRPHATLDLKATEVKPSQPSGAASAASGASSPSGSTTASPSVAGPSSSAASSSAASSSSSVPPTGTKPTGPDAKPQASSGAATDKPASAAAAASKPGTPPAATPPKPAKGSGGGGFLSHLTAGAIGGGLVYAGLALSGPAGLTGPSPEIAERLAALEASTKEGSALGARLADAETRLGKLDQIERSVQALDTSSAETRAMAEAAQKSGAEQRLKKVEDQLSLIASGASDGAEGSVPQLAAISGKIGELEQRLASEVATLRNSGPDADATKTTIAELEHEISQLRVEQQRDVQRTDAVRTNAETAVATAEAVRDEASRLSAAVSALRSSIDAQLQTVAKPDDVKNAIDPIASRMAKLEEDVSGIVRSEDSRRQNAERIVLALELSKLKRALDRGQGRGYAAELAEVDKAAGGKFDLSALARFKETGVATTAELKAEFRPVMNAAIDADLGSDDGSVLDRLMASAKSVVRVRRVSHDASDNSTEAIVARIEAALDNGALGQVIAEAERLSPRAQAPLNDWLVKVTARHSVDEAIAAVEDQLKASLSAAPDTGAAPAAPVQN